MAIHENMCINCKRCLNNPSYPCVWAEKGEPLPDWEATKIKRNYYIDEHGNKITCTGYIIKSCPHFIKDKDYTTMSEFYNYASQELGVQPISIKRYFQRFAKRLEEKTGKPVDPWVYWEKQRLSGNKTVETYDENTEVEK